MLRSINIARQAAINSICSYFVFFQIRSTHDLSANLKKIIMQINEDPKIFNDTDTINERIEIFTAAIAAYARITEYNIKPPVTNDWKFFNTRESKCSTPDIVSKLSSFPKAVSIYKTPSVESKSVAQLEVKSVDEHAVTDLSKVTHSYDQFLDAMQSNQETSQAIASIIKKKKNNVCDVIIFGAGDTGTTLWLEKYKAQHRTTYQKLSEKKLPNVLIIADGSGSWRHDYTLAQTHSSLERCHADKNPSDFVPYQFYKKNPQTNARHVFQANQVCLSSTQAPMLISNVLHIQKRENYSNWESIEHPYRFVVQLPKDGMRFIYTGHIEICTGMGAANLAFDEKIIKPAEVKKLNQFDSKLGFTPIVDGNQFVLTNSEEVKNNRTIIIYGGGGTATACYRKCFFGSDIRTYDRPYTPGNQKNKVIWIFRDYIGTGKLATASLQAAKERKEVFRGELTKVTSSTNSKLTLKFQMLDSDEKSTLQEFLCDQLVYSIGQNDNLTREVCHEVGADLEFYSDKSGMLLSVSTPDKRVNFFGAAAMAFCKAEFIKQTTKWLDAQNIGGDVGAGSMPPTRAQIKRYLALQGLQPKSINANMDTSCLIREFLLEAKINSDVITTFIGELLAARKHDTYGCSRATLEELLKKHQLDKVLYIFGHSHLLIKKKKMLGSSQSLPSLFVLNRRKQNSPTTVVDDTETCSSTVCFRSLSTVGT